MCVQTHTGYFPATVWSSAIRSNQITEAADRVLEESECLVLSRKQLTSEYIHIQLHKLLKAVSLQYFALWISVNYTASNDTRTIGALQKTRVLHIRLLCEMCSLFGEQHVNCQCFE